MKAMLVLVLFALLPVTSTKIIYKSNRTSEIPLSIMDNSVDDMYFSCTKSMSARVKSEYFSKETKDKFFASSWKSADKCMKRAVAKRPKEDEALTSDHLQAICLYTAGGKYNFYKTFNNKVQTSAALYNRTFPYHAVHFWLTSAIQILSSNNQTCHTTYRRTSASFSGKINQKMRFGSFASTSFRTDLFDFGKETCFYIKSCLGAYLKEYPTLGNREQEVLVPPYEMFTITETAKESYKNLTDCKKIYVLKSAGVLSNLNCKVAFTKKN